MGSERDMSQPAGEQQPAAYPVYPGAGQAPTPRPPLTKRMRPVHWIAIDCAVAGFFAVSGAVALKANSQPGGEAPGLPLTLLFMVAVFVPVALRRRAPVPAFGALLILGVLLANVGSALDLTFLAAAFALYTVTVESRRRTGAAALGLLIAVAVFLDITHRHGGSGLVPFAMANVIAWMTGYSVRQRRLYVVQLQQRAASSAVADERLRIARELHDVVAHSMSVIAVQAGYGQYVIDASPGEAKDALGAIQATSRDALEEMRRMLGVLRQQDVPPGPAGGRAGIEAEPAAAQASGEAPGAGSARPRQAPLAPAPGLASLDRLIERTRGAGLRVTVEVTGRPRPAPAGVDLSAYRIIQEALTNVVRHAGTGASCIVSVCYTDAELIIRVTDDGGLPVTLPSVSVASDGGGHGIIGMRERVHLCGGTFGAGPLPNGGFQVMAALPLPVADPQRVGRLADAPRGAGSGAATAPAVSPYAAAGEAVAGAGDGSPAVTSPAVTSPAVTSAVGSSAARDNGSR